MAEDGASDRRSDPAPTPAADGETGAEAVTRLAFDIIICTRNRPEALALSIPLMLTQSRLPKRLIVIDSSDDHAPTAATVARAIQGFTGEVIVEHSPKGLTLQRNIGIRHLRSEVALLPDDDALFHPGTSAALLDVYERDPERRIAAVCAADADLPPPGVLSTAAYDMNATQKRQKRLGRLRRWLEETTNDLNPFLYMGRVLIARAAGSEQLAEEIAPQNCVLVESMSGYRMSFRTETLHAIGGFEETFSGYSWFEDTDASFAAWRVGAVVGARDARIYHHKFPGARGDAYALGAMSLTNRAFVIAKHVADGHFSTEEAQEAKRMMRGFARFKALSALAGAGNASGRAHLRGALAAWRLLGTVLDSPRDRLVENYRASQARLGG